MGGADCELLRDGWLAQPVNAWSSAAFLFAAAWVALRRGAGGALAAAVLSTVAVGSAAYHGPQPGWAEPVHDASIALLLAVVLVEAVSSAWRRPAVLTGPHMRVAVVALASGAVLYLLGRTGGPLCDPDGVVQLHAGWHVAAAVAAGAVLGGGRRGDRRIRSRLRSSP